MLDNTNDNIKEAFIQFLNSEKRNKENKNRFLEIIESYAHSNDREAQFQYASIIESGLVKVDDFQSTFLWYKKSAENGYAPAQYEVGLKYLYGDDIEQNRYEALIWLEKAAYQGYKEALQKVISLYTVGRLVKKNLNRAKYWESYLDGFDKEELGVLSPVTDVLSVPDTTNENKLIHCSNKLADFEIVSQNEVIEAPMHTSFIINAGPGTGKTYTLMQRINNLVKQGVDADNIGILTFTNAVVKEIKNRLKYLSNLETGDRSLRNVEVRTFHSFAYHMLKIANEQLVDEDWEKVDLSFQNMNFEDCLLYATGLISKYPDIVSGWQYFIVDEIQDINHSKAKFVIEIIKSCIKYDVPFMLLGDSCQAIYDYLDDINSEGCVITSEEFYEEILKITQEKALFRSFDINHRQITMLQQMSMPIRKEVLEKNTNQYYKKVNDLAEKLSETNLKNLKGYLDKHKDESICLMERNNFNTKLLSIELIKAGIQHQCVLSTNKNAYPREIGEILGGIDEENLSKNRLKEICQEKGIDEEKSIILWEGIKKETGIDNEIIAMQDIVKVILNHDLDYLFHDDMTNNKVWVSNIHKSKGLEYDNVLLERRFVEKSYKTLDEMKTLYVAITRPKKELQLLEDNIPRHRINYYRMYGNDRAYVSNKKDGKWRYKYIEIIANQDMSDVGPGEFVFDGMVEAQKIIKDIKENQPIKLIFDEKQRKYRITINEKVIGYMSKLFTKQIDKMRRESPMPIGFENIYVDGVYTYVGTLGNIMQEYDNKLMNSGLPFAKHKIWNYISFSGPAKPIYEEK